MSKEWLLSIAGMFDSQEKTKEENLMSKEEIINELSKLSGQNVALFFHIVDAFGETNLYSYANGIFYFDVDGEIEQINLHVGDARFFVCPNQIIRADISGISITVTA